MDVMERWWMEVLKWPCLATKAKTKTKTKAKAKAKAKEKAKAKAFRRTNLPPCMKENKFVSLSTIMTAKGGAIGPMFARSVLANTPSKSARPVSD